MWFDRGFCAGLFFFFFFNGGILLRDHDLKGEDVVMDEDSEGVGKLIFKKQVKLVKQPASFLYFCLFLMKQFLITVFQMA